MTEVATLPEVAVADQRITCAICHAKVHSIQLHLKNNHADLGMTVADYQTTYPDHPVISEPARMKIAEHEKLRAKSVSTEFTTTSYETAARPMHEVFGLSPSPATKGARGTEVMSTVVTNNGGFDDMVSDLDPNYIFNLDILKTLLMGMEMKIPVYLWGHSGTGKTTIYEQISARTGRPMLRVQHTANMEEEHVLGGWRLRDGRTVFELGPLAQAMKNGWVYLADEYDFARPEVLSVYQPVLEGKPLIIKEADPENRMIRPHAGFRFIATGNTNGQGDETGLYQGTTMQNAANYERFGVVEQMPYLDETIESMLVSKQGQIPLADAKKLVDFAGRVRKEFESAKLSNPISPRSLIFAARLGNAKANYLFGIQKAYINRLPSIDREAASQLASRVFGKGA